MDPFIEINNNLRSLHHRYFNTFAAFHIFEELKKAKSPPHAGKKKVHENLKTLNNFQYFFQTVEEATRYYFFIELAKFFDKDNQGRTLTIQKVVDNINQNLHELTRNNFLKYRESISMPVIEPLQASYMPVTKKDIAAWNKTLKSISPVVKNLLDFRHQALAHDDANKTFAPISKADVHKLFKTIAALLNKISRKLDDSTTSYRNAKEAAMNTKLIIQYLTQHKKDKMRELQKKWTSI